MGGCLILSCHLDIGKADQERVSNTSTSHVGNVGFIRGKDDA